MYACAHSLLKHSLALASQFPPVCPVHILLSLQTYRSLPSKHPLLIFDDPGVHMHIYGHVCTNDIPCDHECPTLFLSLWTSCAHGCLLVRIRCRFSLHCFLVDSLCNILTAALQATLPDSSRYTVTTPPGIVSSGTSVMVVGWTGGSGVRHSGSQLPWVPEVNDLDDLIFSVWVITAGYCSFLYLWCCTCNSLSLYPRYPLHTILRG